MPHTYDFFTTSHPIEIVSFVKSIILLSAGIYLARLSAHASGKIIGKYASSQQTMVLQKIIYFSILILFFVAALQELGFRLSVLLGSAGIATAAIAIASQTSISNIISGLFLIMEKSFQIGDKIKVGSTIGTVSSIDLLSVKILTTNNTMIRIPNESLIKSEVTNITRYESRRLDINLKVSIEEDLANIKKLLLDLAQRNVLILKTPLPYISIQDLDSSDIYLQLSVWSNQKNYDNLRDSLYEDIALAFQKHNISI